MNFLTLIFIFVFSFPPDLFGSGHVEDQLVVRQKGWQAPHPGLDREFSAIPTDQHPHLFQVTLRGQILWVLGTWHSMPLEALLPRKIARDLVERSAFLINEIIGECLSGEECDHDKGAEWGFMTPNKIEDLVRRYRDEFKSPYKSEEEVKKNFCLRNEDLATWYDRIGIPELCDFLRAAIDKNIGIGKNNRRVELQLYPFHPLYLHYLISGLEECSIPPGFGVDRALLKLGNVAQKCLLSLETEQDRSKAEGELSLREQVEKADLRQINAQRNNAIPNILSRKILDLLEKGYSGYFPDDVRDYYESMHPIPPLYPIREAETEPSVIHRNKLWAQRLRNSIFSSTFDEGFMFVGAGHLPDLFKRLKRVGCSIAPFSLGEYQEFTHSFTDRDNVDFLRVMRWWNPGKFS